MLRIETRKAQNALLHALKNEREKKDKDKNREKEGGGKQDIRKLDNGMPNIFSICLFFFPLREVGHKFCPLLGSVKKKETTASILC